MNFFYSASVMGYGFGRKWHKHYNFPNFDRVTKTLTMMPKIGIPFAVIPYKNSVWNRVSLHNIGFMKWLEKYSSFYSPNIVVSIHGNEDELNEMIDWLNLFDIKGIEINLSCPNVINYDVSNLNLIGRKKYYLKLSYKDDPGTYLFIDKIDEIRLNSVPTIFGGISGEYAQKYNWKRIKELNKAGYNVAGCSCLNNDDIKRMEDYGCKSIGIGSVILTNPKFVESLKDYE